MSDFEHKEGKGSLFPNTNKKTDDKHDFYGSIRLKEDIKAGEVINVHGYRNETQTSKVKYIGIQVLDKKKENTQTNNNAQVEGDDDNIPF